MKRGLLIVFEGIDRSGKSTQCQMLTNYLKLNGHPCELIKFPNRETSIGQTLHNFLTSKNPISSPQASHLLFSANRWELMPYMRNKLEQGISIIVDRYAFSGVAYSVGGLKLDYEWCKNADKGALVPDLVFFMDIKPFSCVKRSSYGEEIYETLIIQTEVYKAYQMLNESSCWLSIDAEQEPNIIHKQIYTSLMPVLAKLQDQPISQSLWIND